jgi:hypothetical protein
MKQYPILKRFSVLFAVFTAIFIATSPGLAQEPISDAPDYVPGQILVKFKPEVSLQDKQQRLAQVQGNIARSIDRLEVMQVEVPPGQELVVLERLRAQGNVAFASLNYRVHALETPNDPDYSLLWGLDKIEATEAWDTTTGSSSVIIAVIDSGVDLDHPDLQANIIAGYDYVNLDAFPDDDNSHGTHVAGIAAAIGNNGQGVAGVSWKARIMPLKILDYNGDGNIFDLAQATLDAADGGARVINMSLGGSCPFNDWSPVQAAIDYATSKGALVIAASGNQGASAVFCPAALDKVMAVGSTTESDFRSYFSNYGAGLDIVAPGSSIYSTLPGGDYGYKSGTSMATPYASGLAALVWSLNTGLSPEAVRQVLQSTADDLGPAGWDEEYGHGRINAGRAVAKLYNIQLTDAQGQEITQPIPFLVDDQTVPLPLDTKVYISTGSPDTLNWSASVTPNVPWLAISPAAQGQVSAVAAAQFSLLVTQPAAYGTHTATVAVTGKTPGGVEVDTKTVQVQVIYVPQLQRLRFPLIVKQTSLP